MQSQLPLRLDGVLYECANPECFYVGTLLTMHDVVWKDFWNTSLQDMDVRPVCPSCSQPMMHWDGENDGTTTTFV